MATANFPLPDFYSTQRHADNRWQSALFIAGGMHICIFIWALFLPDLFNHRPLLEEAVIIDLVTIAPPEQNVQPSIAQPPKEINKPAVSPPVQKQPEPEISISDPIEQAVEPPPVPVKPISIKPLKRKKKLASDTRLSEVREREKRAAKIKKDAKLKTRQEQLKRQRRKAIAAEMAVKAEREAQRAATDARRELAEVLRQQRELSQTTTKNTGRSTNSSGNKQVQSAIAQQYYASLYQHIQAFWVLPEMRSWDRSLLATIVVIISKDGQVLSAKIEQKSKDPFFDQLVKKTVQNASPMPRFPNMMKKNRIEVGLRFRPGKLEM